MSGKLSGQPPNAWSTTFDYDEFLSSFLLILNDVCNLNYFYCTYTGEKPLWSLIKNSVLYRSIIMTIIISRLIVAQKRVLVNFTFSFFFWGVMSGKLYGQSVNFWFTTYNFLERFLYVY